MLLSIISTLLCLLITLVLFIYLKKFEKQQYETNQFGIYSQFQENTGIPCVLKIQEDIEVSSLKMRNYIDIFRIIQESLNNIQMHDQAENVSIVLTSNNTEESKKSLKIFITDDGIGFDVKEIERKALAQRHYGLSNIRERARSLSGSLTIISDEGSGLRRML